MQSASGLHAALMAASQAPDAPSPFTHVLHVASAAFGVAAQSVAPHWLMQFAVLQMHACAAASKVFAPAVWFVPQQLMHELVSGCIRHAASPPPPLDEAPLEPPDEVPLEPPDEVPLDPPLDVPDEPPDDVPLEPPLLLVLDPPLELVDEPPEDELLFPPSGSVAFEPVPMLSPGITVVVGDDAQATRTAPRAVMGSARARCRMGEPPSGRCASCPSGARRQVEKRPPYGETHRRLQSLCSFPSTLDPDVKGLHR
jgi:hypothetical protein